MEEMPYIAIDLKSFYASCECVERGLDPMNTNLVVADIGRTEKTICLAVTPSLKEYKIPGRARLFEVISRVREINEARLSMAPNRRLTGKSYDKRELSADPSLALDYIVAAPRMAHYMEFSSRIYKIYLKYIAPEDIHVYSVDEVFIDASRYLKMYNITSKELCRRMIGDVLRETGITATAGIGSNLYLAKVAMDIQAKHIPADEDGVRIAMLDTEAYRRLLWEHRPLTSFWRVGEGYAKKLEAHGLYTMGDIAKCSVGRDSDFHNEKLLYKLFGVNAQLLIDHAWGYEPCTIAQIKAYRPTSNSLSSGQVLTVPYTFEKARIVVMEMTDALVLDLVDKGLCSDKFELTVGYDVCNVSEGKADTETVTDRYGRSIPKHSHKTVNFGKYTSSAKEILKAVGEVYDRICRRDLFIRRITVSACNVVNEKNIPKSTGIAQIGMFDEFDDGMPEDGTAEAEKERKLQETVIGLKKRFGKNCVLKGRSYEEGATAKDRNRQIGGHKA